MRSSHAFTALATLAYPNIVAFDPEKAAADQTPTLDAAYEETNSVYWNAQNSEYRAACAFLPENAEQVSSAVKLLNKFPSVKLGLRDCVRDEPSRVGGGLSYYSAQYGLACDNVDIFEAVLADGSIVQATKEDNADLWFALRGGGNQFAIITRMWMQAHPLGDNGKVWGGTRAYSAIKRKELFKALSNFIANNNDGKAAIIPTFQFALPGNLLTTIVGPLFFFFYDGSSPPKGVFDEFDAIDAVSDNTQTTSYTELTSTTGGGAPLPGFSTSFETNTFPNMPTNQRAEFLNEYFNRASATTFRNSLALDIRIGGFDPQPVPALVANASQAQGGNALGLGPLDGDRIFVENNALWLNDDCNEKCPASFASLAAGMTAYHKENFAGVKPTNYQEGDVEYIS